jgi:hypothetical protein
MKIKVNKFDFATGKVVALERDIPDDPPSTPLLEALRRKKSDAALKEQG